MLFLPACGAYREGTSDWVLASYTERGCSNTLFVGVTYTENNHGQKVYQGVSVLGSGNEWKPVRTQQELQHIRSVLSRMLHSPEIDAYAVAWTFAFAQLSTLYEEEFAQAVSKSHRNGGGGQLLPNDASELATKKQFIDRFRHHVGQNVILSTPEELRQILLEVLKLLDGVELADPDHAGDSGYKS